MSECSDFGLVNGILMSVCSDFGLVMVQLNIQKFGVRANDWTIR